MPESRGVTDGPTRRLPGRPIADEGPAVDHDEIVSVALGDLARNSYAGLSLRALARPLGVSVRQPAATRQDCR